MPVPEQNPGKRPQTAPTPIVVTQEQIDEQAASQIRAQARGALEFDLIATLLPVLNGNVSLANLRYTIGLAIDVAQSSPNGLASQGLAQQ